MMAVYQPAVNIFRNSNGPDLYEDRGRCRTDATLITNEELDTMKFRDLTGLTTLLKWSLGVSIAMAIVSIWSTWLEIDLLQRIDLGGFVTEAEALANDSRQGAIGSLAILLAIITGVIFLRWLFLSHSNVGALGATNTVFTSGWAIGWYFIPFANLWKPYQALSETFEASHPDHLENWWDARRPDILPLWWGLWILSAVVGRFLVRSGQNAESLEDVLQVSWMTLGVDIVYLFLCVVAILVVGKLHSWQTQKHERLQAAVAASGAEILASAPPPEDSDSE